MCLQIEQTYSSHCTLLSLALIIVVVYLFYIGFS